MQIATMLREAGKSDAAVSMLEELVNRFPGSDSARRAFIKLANIKKENGDLDGAVEYYLKALTKTNNEANAQIQYEIAEIYENKQSLARASEEYLKVPMIYPAGIFWSVRAELKCAKIFERLNRPDDALRLYEKLSGMDIEESVFAKKRLEALKSNIKK